GSSYGAVIPRIWGDNRTSANVIWVQKDANGNHLYEHSRSTGGGGKGLGGGGGSTEYWYTASMALHFCQGEHTFPDGTSEDRNVSLVKLWANDKVVWDVAEGTHTLNLTFYSGSETQLQDPLMVIAEGADAPAVRGYAYCVIQDMDLSDFGGSVPNFSAELTTDAVTDGDIASDMMRACGLLAADIDVTDATSTVRGLLENSLNQGSQSLEPLHLAFQTDRVEVDGKIKLVSRGRASDRTVSENDLGSHTGSPDNATPRVTRTQLNTDEFPGILTVEYSDYDTHFEQGTQTAKRHTDNLVNTANVAFNMTMTADEADALANVLMDQKWSEDSPYEIALPLKYLDCIPSDVLTVPTENGNIRLRVVDVQDSPGAEIRLSLINDSVHVLTQQGSGTGGTGPGNTTLPIVPTEFIAWSGTEIHDDHMGIAGFYAAGWGESGWSGANVYYSLDGGTTYILGGAMPSRSAFGVTTSTLSAVGAVADTFDDTNTVAVNLTLSEGALASDTDSNIEAGSNQAIIGEEIVGFGTATLGATYNYTLSHLRRGERASVMSGHATGERFCQLTSAVVRVALPDSAIGDTVKVKVVSTREDIADVTAKNVVIMTPNPKPPRIPTAHAASHMDGGSDELLLNELGDPSASVEFAQQQALQFRIENRTSDPSSPAAGEIWLRTDL
ncbi:MAG: phage tail protein, partial [Fimbriimonadaceae bacterium]